MPQLEAEIVRGLADSMQTNLEVGPARWSINEKPVRLPGLFEFLGGIVVMLAWKQRGSVVAATIVAAMASHALAETAANPFREGTARPARAAKSLAPIKRAAPKTMVSQAAFNPFRIATAGALEQSGRAQAEKLCKLSTGGDPRRPAMTSLGVDISLPAGQLPTTETQALVADISLAGDMPRPWPTQVYNWQAAATRHQPLYFEEINAERYGYSCNWVAQPLVSTAHFFATIPALPYLKTANCPGECQYTLGHYRAGSCPPYRRHCPPCDCLAATAEAGSIWWLIAVLP